MTGEADRHLDWEGCFNVRDLGGLPTRDGRVTRRGAVIRADTLDDLTAGGWEALMAHCRRGTTAPALVVALFAELDVEAHLRAAGLTQEDVAALRARLLGP